MATRRQAREWAVQLLFQLDASARTAAGAEDSLDLENVFTEFWANQLRLLNEASESPLPEEELFLADGWEDRVADGPTRRFCEAIVSGVAAHLPVIDQTIAEAASHWKLDRMGGVERSALRMGAYEILFCDEVPVPVAINEAIDVCRYFGMRDSARFVNGVLDHIAHAGPIHKSGRRPSAADEDEGETWSPPADPSPADSDPAP